MAIHYLYRFYNAKGLLLYVGRSTNAIRRMCEHKSENIKWTHQVSLIKIVKFRSVKKAIKMEKDAIESECPVYNVLRKRVSKGKLLTQAEAAKYLGISYQYFPTIKRKFRLKVFTRDGKSNLYSLKQLSPVKKLFTSPPPQR